VVVVGLPRTGTTLLHTLLGCDPEALVLPFWQLRRPYPIPRRRLDRAPRMVRAAAMARLARSMAPGLRDIHPVSDRPGRRPVLKSPFHLGRLKALLAEVPEAMVVWTHRDPAVALASWCSLAAVLASAASDQVDLDALGRRWLSFWAAEVDRALAARAAADPTRFHDVAYGALVADPLSEMERLYAGLDLELSGGARQRMSRWIGRHHDRGRRPHRYSLADFGLDPAVIDGCFARYREWVAAATQA
jgi:Sulfotransferase family